MGRISGPIETSSSGKFTGSGFRSHSEIHGLQSTDMASLMHNTRLEYLMWGCMGMGIGFSVLQKTFGGWGAKQGGRTAKVFIELQRKSFHMIGGCIICLIYHYGYAPIPKSGETD